MTTVAYDGKILASDSRCTSGSFIWPQSQKKIFQFAKGDIYLAYSGGHSNYMDQYILTLGTRMEDIDYEYQQINGHIVFDWEDQLHQNEDVDFECLIFIRNHGIFYGDSHESHYFSRIDNIPISIGSGTPYALGAMAAGSTAIDAVEIASRYDSNTDCRIVHYDLSDFNLEFNS